MKLYTYPGNPRAMKTLVAAEYVGVPIELPEFDMQKDLKSKSFKSKCPTAKVPMLETEEGCLFESNAIARYVARLRPDVGLHGKTFFDSAQVDAWCDFSTNNLETPCGLIFYPVLGIMPFNAEADEKARNDIKSALQILDNHLRLRTFVVGEDITLADIILCCTLLYPFKMLLDKDFRKPYSNVTRWFTTCVAQPEFQVIMGDVPLCDKATKAPGDESGNKKQAAKKEKKEKPAEEAPKPKKQEHPLAILNREKPSSMPMDSWKVQYSNNSGADAMKWFWENLDQEGYSVWFCDYNYNEENKMAFMVSNAVTGFLQRSEEVRKYAFGVMDVCGKEKEEIIITGCWLFRGDSEKHMIDANPDAEYYTWTRVTDFSDENKARIEAYWTNEEELEGRPIMDSKVFK